MYINLDWVVEASHTVDQLCHNTVLRLVQAGIAVQKVLVVGVTDRAAEERVVFTPAVAEQYDVLDSTQLIVPLRALCPYHTPSAFSEVYMRQLIVPLLRTDRFAHVLVTPRFEDTLHMGMIEYELHDSHARTTLFTRAEAY